GVSEPDADFVGLIDEGGSTIEQPEPIELAHDADSRETERTQESWLVLDLNQPNKMGHEIPATEQTSAPFDTRELEPLTMDDSMFVPVASDHSTSAKLEAKLSNSNSSERAAALADLAELGTE